MGFFDKKKRDDEGDASEVLPARAQTGDINRSSDLHRSSPPPAEAQSMKVQPPPPPPADKPANHEPAPNPAPHKAVISPAFGIEEAVQLMRQLPNRNVDLVVQVVKRTLEALHVDVARIIDGATKKDAGIEQRIAGLKHTIETLEGQIAQSKKEIAHLEAEQREVATVKERMLLAQKLELEGAAAAAQPTSDRSAVPAPAPAAKVVVGGKTSDLVPPAQPPPPPKV